MILKYFDAHSHVSFKDYDKDRDEVLSRMQEAQVGTITIGVDVESSKNAVAFANLHDNIWATIGHHPMDNVKEQFDEVDYKEIIKHPKVVGIGECGLDYFRIKDDVEKEKKRQKEDFLKQIEFAIENDKPLMLHCRPSKGTVDAYEDALDMLNSKKKTHGDNLRGNFHFFVGSVDVARRAYELGFTTSFPGVITFASDYDDVVKFAPIDMILSETDSPFAAPIM